MKIAIAGLVTETNSFNRFQIGREEFSECFAHQTVPDWRQRVGDSIALGMIDYCEMEGIEVVPLYLARTLPAGLVRKADYLAMRAEIIAALQKVEVDALCLALHGSMLVDGFDDPEGDLLNQLARVAPQLPLHIAVDMHATVTPDWLLRASSISAYKTAPHCDIQETGALCARLAHRSFLSRRPTCVQGVRVPLLLSGELSMTTCEPMASLCQQLSDYEQQGLVLSASYTLAFPWADSPYLGCYALVSCYQDEFQQGRNVCERLAQELWQQRHQFTMSMEHLTVDEALKAIAKHRAPKPILLSDLGDNATAGAAEENVDFLAKLLEAQIKDCFFAAIYDPQSYSRVAQIRPGESLVLNLGRFYRRETALEVQATLRKLFCHHQRQAALIQIGGIDVVVSHQRLPVADTSIFLAAGVRSEDYRSLVLKCGYHGDDLFNIAARNVLVLTVGDTDPVLERLPYSRIPRPIFPLDKEMTW